MNYVNVEAKKQEARSNISDALEHVEKVYEMLIDGVLEHVNTPPHLAEELVHVRKSRDDLRHALRWIQK